METEEVAPVNDSRMRNPVLKLLAQLISVVFHPLFIATYAFFFVGQYYPYLFAHLSGVNKLQLFVVLFTNTVIFPGVTLLIMSKLGFISSLSIEGREERIIPLIAMGLFYFWTYLVIKQMEIGNYFNQVMLGGSLAVFAAFFFNNFFKISIHAVAAGTFLGVAFTLVLISSYNLLLPLLLVILIAGLIGSARLYLQVHTSRDVYAGYAVGMLAQLVAFQLI